jgi:hypothetical protein
MHIEVIRRKYPYTIDDAEIHRLKVPKRIQLTDRMLAKQLGFSRDLIREYLRQRLLHVQGPGETQIGMGISSEEIAGLMLMAHLHQHYQVPFRYACRSAGNVIVYLMRYPHEAQVMMALSSSNSGWRVDVGVSEKGDRLEATPGYEEYVRIFDCTLLAEEIEKRLDQEPFMVPPVGDCMVKNKAG